MAERRLNSVLAHIRKLFAVQEDDALSDRALLNRFIKDRDEAAVTALIERHGPMILGLCRRVLGHVHDAEDACQATFLVLVRKAASVRKQQSLASWLHGVAFHVATNLKRELARRRRREAAAAQVAQPSATENLTAQEVQCVLDEELARLPERLRAPLVLCYLEGKTREEAAKQLRWTVGTLRGRLERGRERLRARLSHRGLALPAALFATGLGSGDACMAMSPLLALATARGMMSTGTGTAAPSGAVPATVAALVEGVLKTMLLHKLLKVTAVLCALAGFVAAVGLIYPTQATQPPLAQQSQETPKTSPTKAGKAQDEEKVRQAAKEGQDQLAQDAKTDEAMTTLLKSRVVLAQKAYDVAAKALGEAKRIGGNTVILVGKPEDVYTWSVRWLQADRDLHPKEADQIAALDRHLKRVTELETKVKSLVPALLPPSAEFEVEWYRTEAELWLAKAKAKK